MTDYLRDDAVRWTDSLTNTVITGRVLEVYLARGLVFVKPDDRTVGPPTWQPYENVSKLV